MKFTHEITRYWIKESLRKWKSKMNLTTKYDSLNWFASCSTQCEIRISKILRSNAQSIDGDNSDVSGYICAVEMAALFSNITTQFILINRWNAKNDSALEAILNWPQFDLMFFVSIFYVQNPLFFPVLRQFCVKSNVNIWLHCHWSQKRQPNDILSMKVN